MRIKLRKKLHSRRGASITFALLLFMICAAVGSVLLVSATAAAGRASGNYEYDQRYYAVTSAAELLRDTLDGQSAGFTLTRESTLYQATAHSTVAGVLTAGTPSELAEDPDTVKYSFVISHPVGASVLSLDDLSTSSVPLATDVSTAADLIGKAAISLVAGKDVTALESDAWLMPSDNGFLPAEMTLTISPKTGSTADTSGLTVKIKPTLESGGTLLLKVSNDAAAGEDRYVLQITLVADVRETSNTSQTFNHSQVSNIVKDPDGTLKSMTQTDYYDKLVTKNATVTWRVAGVGKAAWNET